MNDLACVHLAADVRSDLLKMWAEPHRRYHTTAHLAHTLDSLDALRRGGVIFDTDAVELAAWFHDAVYDISAVDNEERSATLALNYLGGSAIAPEVARLVRLTSSHQVIAGDTNGAALCDADLAVLAGSPKQYADYTRLVRLEYASVPDDAFAAGRMRVLRGFLASSTIYSTAFGRAFWEERARSNLAREIDSLAGDFELNPGLSGDHAPNPAAISNDEVAPRWPDSANPAR